MSAPPAASEAAAARKARRDGAGVLGPSDMIDLLDFNELSARSDQRERFRKRKLSPPYATRCKVCWQFRGKIWDDAVVDRCFRRDFFPPALRQSSSFS